MPPPPHPVDIMLEEYRTLRQEVFTSMQTQQSILSFGTAALGILLAGAFNVFDEPLAAALIFLGFTPLLSHLILVLWMTEVSRMLRAGYFLAGVEARVDALLGERELLSWERWAHARRSSTEAEGDPRIRLREVDRRSFQLVSAMLLSIALGGIAIGNYEITRLESGRTAWVAVLNIAAVVVTVGLGIQALHVYKQGKALRERDEYDPPQVPEPRTSPASLSDGTPSDP